MKTEEFNKIVDETCESIKKVLQKKADEYASADDRLHNFKRAGQARGKTPLEALDGMMLKHEVSYLDIIDMSKSGKIVPLALIEEKIGDFINYLVLAKGLIIDSNNEKLSK